MKAKQLTYLFTLVALLIFSSCSSTVEFPKSNIVPAAKIEVKSDTDDFGNNTFDFKVEHLASAERLSPPKSVYVVWAETESNGVINLGQIQTDAEDKAEFHASTPFKVNQVL